MRARVVAGVLILAASGGCSTLKHHLTTVPETVARPATGTPGTFVLADGSPNLTTDCPTPLQDPQDKGAIQLVRVLRNGLADYSVPAGKYGVSDNELLRVDCTTGRTIGIARRQ